MEAHKEGFQLLTQPKSLQQISQIYQLQVASTTIASNTQKGTSQWHNSHSKNIESYKESVAVVNIAARAGRAHR